MGNLLFFSLLIIALIAVFFLYLFVFQSRMIYFPHRKINLTPEALNLSYEDVFFATSDGVRLNGWYIPAENPRGVLLFCHGNAGNISHRLESITLFNRLGLSVFIFDYRGYGLSSGKPGEQGTYDDAEAAWRYLVEKRNIAGSDIFLFGRSIGGVIASHLAQGQKVRALIIESCFTDIRDLGAQLYPFLPVRLLSRYRYSTVKYLRNVDCPVLIIHSGDDEMISIRHGRKLFDAAGEPKEFLEISGSHNEGFVVSGQQYENGLDSFISRY